MPASRKRQAQHIALFNHKGGVSKTTSCFNVGWMMASKGHRVLLVDADPQCNLSGLMLGYRGVNEFERFYEKEPDRNLRSGLAPAFESKPEQLKPVDAVQAKGNKNLFLLPGHIRLSEYEVTLGIAQELSGSIQTLQNLPGSIRHLIGLTAEAIGAEYVLIDMNPSLSSINQNISMTSDFFIVPCSPDYFSVMALDSLASVLPRWKAWADKAASLDVLRSAVYPFPSATPRFLGTIVQKYRIRVRASEDDETAAPSSGTPAAGFQRWIDALNASVHDRLFPALERARMVLPASVYKKAGIDKSNYCLATISDFNSLIAKSQEAQVPVYRLTDKQLGLTGTVLANTLKSKEMFKTIFTRLADEIIDLTA